MIDNNVGPDLKTGDAREPLLTRGAIVATVSAVLGVAVAFGLHLSGVQREAILYATGIVGPLAVAALARRHVNSPASTRKALAGREPRL